ncbi:hypothetical protein BVX97_01700 [bacterium E08(2017)]|nr:hypothetical protein BVX97_01700 [bacterium E08(2017)]
MQSKQVSIIAAVFFSLMLVSSVAKAQETGSEALWYFCPGVGLYDYEGDQEVADGFVLTARLGYDFTQMWSLEGVLTLAPSLDVNDVGFTEIDPVTGQTITGRRNLADFDSTWGAGLSIDGLYHFTRWERLDPYLALGGGFIFFGDKVNDSDLHASVRAGGGVMYHFNDMWAIRADGRALLFGSDHAEANSVIDAALVWTWGAYVPPDISATGSDGPLDSDGDGLSDDEEAQYGTDPLNPDTDADGLSDRDEIRTYSTDPLNSDTDYDALRDGDEVLKFETDPLKRDTDGGGVADGHEVLEDGTDPLNPADDLMLVELYIQFDYDKSVIKPQYYSDIDAIGKVLNRNPDSTAVVEGHADQKKASSAKYNQKLSERRAKAVVDYLVTSAGVDKARLKAVGYGFSRPKEKPDLVNGNPANRRVEVYIRNASDDMGMVEKPTPAENK